MPRDKGLERTPTVHRRSQPMARVANMALVRIKMICLGFFLIRSKLLSADVLVLASSLAVG